VNLGVVNKMIQDENSLREREAALRLPDVFDAVRISGIELAEEQRDFAHKTAISFERIRAGLGGFGDRLKGLDTGMQSVVVGLFDAVTNFAQGLAQRLGASGPNAGLGGGIGALLGGAFAGAQFGAAFGPLGAAAGGIAGSLFGGLFDRATDNTTTAMNTLATTTERVNEALSNLPQGFKIARDRFLATTGVNVGGPINPPSGGTGGTLIPGASSGNVVVNGDLHVNGVNVTGSQSLVRAILEGAQTNIRRGGQGLLLATAKA